jgi:3-methyladenine DNA glycosylase AlkC
MAEALKHSYNKEFINRLVKTIQQEHKKFDGKNFTKKIFNKGWKDKELKQRMRHICECLQQFLPQDYAKALKILKPVSENFSGFEPMFFPDFVEVYGLNRFEESMRALAHFTKYSSSEFAVRPFLIKEPKKMMKQMEKWALSKNEHHRRLASEGCRPRLPWAFALPEFKKNPAAVLKILEKLKNDESEYVRKSVANNLNDISKDHADLVLALAKKWLGKSKKTDWVVKHGCRTLLKKGDARALKLFAILKPKHVLVQKLKIDKTVKRGQRLGFSFELISSKKQLGKLRIEYVINFMKKNGEQAPKVFKISEAEVLTKEKKVNKEHSFKLISTRKYYPGEHGLFVIVNGEEKARGRFKLL